VGTGYKPPLLWGGTFLLEKIAEVGKDLALRMRACEPKECV
jgi:hypothetical protein